MYELVVTDLLEVSVQVLSVLLCPSLISDFTSSNLSYLLNIFWVPRFDVRYNFHIKTISNCL